MSGEPAAPLEWSKETGIPEHLHVQGKTVKRWGVQTLIFLGVAFLGVMLSSVTGGYTVVTLCLVLVGFVGAARATGKGLKAMYDIPPDQRARGRSKF